MWSENLVSLSQPIAITKVDEIRQSCYVCAIVNYYIKEIGGNLKLSNILNVIHKK